MVPIKKNVLFSSKNKTKFKKFITEFKVSVQV